MAHAVATWLLPIFFALIGIELKNEVKVGAFKKRSDLLIPFSAASFGVLIPFLIYKVFSQFSTLPVNGWGLVIATDLPLALLALKFFDRTVQSKLRPYLLSLAIFDDLISILLIAIIFNQNGIHPTVYGFLIGLFLPIKPDSRTFDWLNKISNYAIIPLFVALTIAENLSFQFGALTFVVLIARMGGKPIGIYLGDLIARKSLKSQILNITEILAVGALATLGLSVSLLFAEISGTTGMIVTSILATIAVALIRIKILSKTFLKGNF